MFANDFDAVPTKVSIPLPRPGRTGMRPRAAVLASVSVPGGADSWQQPPPRPLGTIMGCYYYRVRGAAKGAAGKAGLRWTCWVSGGNAGQIGSAPALLGAELTRSARRPSLAAMARTVLQRRTETPPKTGSVFVKEVVRCRISSRL